MEEAYRRTEFRVEDRRWSLVLRHGEHSKALAECHGAFGVTSSAYITAWNPRSEPTSLEDNDAGRAYGQNAIVVAGRDAVPRLVLLRGEGSAAVSR